MHTSTIVKFLALIMLLSACVFAQKPPYNQPCGDFMEGCYNWANNVASSNCKAQGGCSSVEWDEWYSNTIDICTYSSPACNTEQAAPKGKQEKNRAPIKRSTLVPDFVWNSSQRTHEVLLALAKR